VLCDANLLATVDGARAERLKNDGRVRVAPRGQVDLEIEGRDQRGRRFPDEYLALGYRADGCGRLLQFEDRNRGIRLRARGEAGQCRVEIWVPGNLNFSWALDIEVDPAARTTYSRRDAETVVRALYPPCSSATSTRTACAPPWRRSSRAISNRSSARWCGAESS
jgi:hypothetical protein